MPFSPSVTRFCASCASNNEVDYVCVRVCVLCVCAACGVSLEMVARVGQRAHAPATPHVGTTRGKLSSVLGHVLAYRT